MKCKREYKRKNKINILPIIIFIFIITLSIGYSSLNKNLSITTEAKYEVEEDIRITDIKLVESKFNGLESYNATYSKDVIKTGITLEDVNSSITYEVTITNTGNVPMNLENLENIIYNNSNITYSINKTLPLIIPKQSEEKIQITFKLNEYNKDNILLDSEIKFNFKKKNSVLARGTNNAYFINNSSFDRSKVESITFVSSTDLPEDVEINEYWDASLNKDGSVIAYMLDSNSNDLKELYIGGYGQIELSVASYLFYNFTNVESINFDSLVTTEKVENMSYMFNNCKSLISIDLSSFDTSDVTNMSYMFCYCSSLISLNLSNFNTENVTILTRMFNGCTNLVSVDLTSFDTKNVTDMSFLFRSCSSLEGMLDLSHFDVSKVTTMGYMIDCPKLTKLILNNWNAENLELNSYKILNNCTSVVELEMNNFNAPKIINLSGFYSSFTNAEKISINNFNVINVQNLSSMFNGCLKLTELNIENFNAPSVTDMSYMFNNCKSLISIDVSNFDTSSVTDMKYMFEKCSSLTSLDVSSFNTENVVNMSHMFFSCSSLKELNLSNFNTENVTKMTNTFGCCTSLTSLDISNLNIENLTDVAYIFQYVNLTEIYFNNVDSSMYEKDIFKTMMGQLGNITFYVKDSTCKELLEEIKPNAIINIVNL